MSYRSKESEMRSVTLSQRVLNLQYSLIENLEILEIRVTKRQRVSRCSKNNSSVKTVGRNWKCAVLNRKRYFDRYSLLCPISGYC